MQSYHSWVEINTHSIKKNLKNIVRHLQKNQSFIFMAKTNSYGHGTPHIANLAIKYGAKYIGVNYLEEATELRTKGIQEPIMLFINPNINLFNRIFEFNLTPVIYNLEFLKKIISYTKKNNLKVKIHIKIETGMNRFGFTQYDLETVIKLIKKNPQIILEGILTHFSDIDPKNNEYYFKQNQLFNLALKHFKSAHIIPIYVHAAATEAFYIQPKSIYNLLRLGDAIYGIYPSSERKFLFKLEPALSWKTKIISINKILRGSFVGYKRAWQAKRDSYIAVIGVGYGDGFRRSPYSCSYVICNGFKVPVIGKVCMANSFIDITDCYSLVKIGDDVVIIGKQKGIERTIDEVAEDMGTISDEVVTSISSLLPRVYK